MKLYMTVRNCKPGHCSGRTDWMIKKVAKAKGGGESPCRRAV